MPEESLKFIDGKQAAALLDQAGSQGRPCFFFCDFEAERWHVALSGESFHGIQFRFPNAGNCPAGTGEKIELQAHPPIFDDYQQSFSIVHNAIKQGRTYLCNLTAVSRIEGCLSLEDLFAASQADYRIYVPNLFACFSPETFVKTKDGQIFTYPMKGTAPASHPDALAQLLANEKEKAEHATIVDLLRNDLSMICDNVRVLRYRYHQLLPTHAGGLYQISSEICGRLPEAWQNQLGSMLARLLPAGSICGAPKPETLRTIALAEGVSRGFYTGIAGYFDGKELDSCVMIRFAEQTPQGLAYRSGGGITFMSNPEEEYHELIHKIYVPYA